MAARRSTFGLDLDNEINRNRMSIGPMRLQAVTKQAGTGGPRQSLAPNALPRPSMGRPSLAPGALGGMGNAAGSASFAPRASDFAMSDRRGSIYRSLATAEGPRKDPRNIRDKGYQHQCIRLLIHYLADAGYDRPISPKILSAPSVKDFQNIFTFLYHQLDPAYVFGPKFDDELPVLIRNLGYPFYSDISKSNLQAVGSMHAWPVLLAMLTWLVELIVSQRHQACGLNAKHQQSPQRERVFFNYLAKAYQMWMAGHDTFDSLLADLGQSFDKKNQTMEAEISLAVEQQRRLRQQLEQLDRDQPPLSVLQQRKAELESDIGKYNKVIEILKAKNAKLSAGRAAQQQDLEQLTADIAATTTKKAQLQDAVANQELSASDVDAMKQSLTKLEESCEAAVKAREQAAAQAWDREMALVKKQSQVESAVNAYHATVARLQLPSSDGGRAETQYMVSVDMQAPQSMLTSLKNTLRPALAQLRQSISDQVHAAREQQLAIQDRIDNLNEQLLAAQENISLLESQLMRVDTSTTAEKERMNKELAAETAEIDALEMQLVEMRQDAGPLIVQRQGKLQKLRMEYEATAQALDAEKERYNREILAMLETLVDHKKYIETTLEDLLATVNAM